MYAIPQNSVLSAARAEGLAGLGDAACYPPDFAGPLPEGATTCADNSATVILPCYPCNFAGPLPAGGAYCAGCGAPSTSSAPGVSKNTVMLVGGLVLAGFLFISMAANR